MVRRSRYSMVKEYKMISQLIAPVTGLLDKFIEDKDQKARLAHEVATMAQKHAQELAKGQLEINKAEAQSRSIFVAGWRPFIGWVCGVALAYNFIIRDLFLFLEFFFESHLQEKHGYRVSPKE